MGIGAISRDQEGAIIAALRQHMHLPLGPLEAEAKSLDVAVSFAWDIGIRDVIFETDSNTPPAAIVDIMESI